ncbi:MAG TPA: type II CAAX endopeptidase family protein [Anaerolineaceae bacterium]|nr:type II CAAX endopeptidase family protein [Anaerolineaceae bacterium]
MFMRKYLSRHPPVAFAVLAYAFSWLLWWAAEAGGTSSLFLEWLGGFGPALAAILLTGLLEGREALRLLLMRVFAWRFHPLLYLAALTVPIIGTLLLIALYALASGDSSALELVGPWLVNLARVSPVLLLTLALGWIVVTGEEIGWRGYLLPRLQARHSDLVASLLVGLVWGLWHLPELWPLNPGRDPVTLPLFLADIVLISVIYTWLHVGSHGSILLVSLFHGVYDLMVMYASASLPFIGQTRGMETVVVLGMAIGIVAIYGYRSFARDPNRALLPWIGKLKDTRVERG